MLAVERSERQSLIAETEPAIPKGVAGFCYCPDPGHAKHGLRRPAAIQQPKACPVTHDAIQDSIRRCSVVWVTSVSAGGPLQPVL